MLTETSLKQPTAESSLIELLKYRAHHQPDKLAYQFLVDGKQAGPAYTYSMLDLQARAIATCLKGLQGERALLLYPQGIEVMAAFFGCLYAGVIAIPVPPPDAGRLKRTLPRLQEIVKDAEATLVLSIGRIINLIQTSGLDLPEFQSTQWIDTEKIDVSLAKD
ncbi:MAG: AMP-binding protein, partial [Cyanobacteria bacterium P01_D01_bin.56]